MSVKSYGELCPLARALDVVGDRWAMLVVRELVLGPRRYSDLADGLPGIGSNILAARLAELQQAGIITKLTLPRPTPVTVYQLAEAGRALQPAIGALSAWGAAHGRPPAEGDVLRPAWLLIRALGRPTTLRENDVCEMDIEGEVVSLTAGPAGLRIETGAVRDADAKMTLSLDVLAALLSSPAPPPARPAGIEIRGDCAVARRAIDTLAGALRARRAEPAPQGGEQQQRAAQG
jgi:DNA-binding HxlR family transcriptional regulator